MSALVDVLRAAWHGRRVYGWQDWADRVDRAAMVADWRRGKSEG